MNQKMIHVAITSLNSSENNVQLKYSSYVAFSHVHGFAVNNSGLLFQYRSFCGFTSSHFTPKK